MGIFGNKKEETSSLFSRIGTAAGICSRHGGIAADAYSASTGGNPSILGSDLALEQGRNEGFSFDAYRYSKL